MPAASHKSTGDLTHHQAHIVDYISDIASELAQMADRAGCENLGRDLRQAILTAHDTGEKSTSDGL
jgi:hypothetical protein